MSTTIATTIRDEATNIQQLVTIGIHETSIAIEPAGCQLEDGNNQVLFLEHYEGQWRVIVFAEPNQEEPTHTIVIPKTIDPDEQWKEKYERCL